MGPIHQWCHPIGSSDMAKAAKSLTRRELLISSSAIGLSAMAYSRVAAAAFKGAPPILGMIGCGGRSNSLLNGLGKHATIKWACDPDRSRAEKTKTDSGATDVAADLRRVLDDNAVDGVVIATPDHWHAPAAILACQAGKHVYVEKPCSHNFREGQRLVQAARENGVVVQHGTQSRSNRFIVDAIQMIKEGLIGEVLSCKAWNIQRRRNIGKGKPSVAPPNVDYDLWVGPAEFLPYQANRFHYDWHWWYNFGTGDLGNDGTHEMDIARWGLGTHGLPSIASAVGGKLYFDDDQQFPDTATCTFQWEPSESNPRTKQLIFEMRIWSRNYPHNVDTGVEFYGTRGMIFVSKRGKLRVWGENNQPLNEPKPQHPPELKENHQLDFLAAIVDGNLPTADIEIGHDSCSLVHLANISQRLGRTLQIDPDNPSIKNDEPANQHLGRNYREAGHWAIPDFSGLNPINPQAKQTLDLVNDGRSVDIRLNQQSIGTYVYQDSTIPRPYLKNITNYEGVAVTRRHPPNPSSDADHANMHPGIWMAFGDLSGHDFWRNESRIQHAKFIEPPISRGSTASFTEQKEYRTPTGSLVCNEIFQLTCRIFDASILFTFDSEFSSDQPFYFGDQEEMGIGIRVRPEINERQGGQLLDSKKRMGAKEIWSQASRWCDYSGTIQNQKTGITLMCHPDNFRESWMHARDYGLLAANPFGRKAMQKGKSDKTLVKPGEALRLRYGVWIHGSVAPGEINQAYRDYVGNSD